MVNLLSALVNFPGSASIANTAKQLSEAPQSPSPPPSNITQFPVGASWQIVLHQRLAVPPSGDFQPDFVNVWDIDLLENTEGGADNTTILFLKNLPSHPKVICYFSAGSYENWRLDWPTDFDNDNYGSPLKGWDGEYWLDIGSEAVQEVMFNRIRMAAELGCDAVDPDNVDGYGEAPENKGNRTGKPFTLTQDKTVDFLEKLAKVAHENSIAIGLKNALEVLPRLQNVVNFAVNEQCVENKECSSYSSFVSDLGKPVFHIEYPNGDDQPETIPIRDTEKWCRTYEEDGVGTVNISKLSTVFKDMELDGWVEYCDGKEFRTSLAP